MFFVHDLEKLSRWALKMSLVKILTGGVFQKEPKKMPENIPR
jgi:hypothetical protein